MALKVNTLIVQGAVVSNAYVTVHPISIIKEERTRIVDEVPEAYYVFVQKYNVVVKNEIVKFNYEQEFDLEVEGPSYAQCYNNLKSKLEYKDSENV